MVPVVLSDDLLAMQLPQPRIVVRACRHQIRRIRTEGAIPNPALVACKCSLQREGFGFFVVLLWCKVLDFPDLCCMIGAACGQLLYIWREEDSCDIFFMGVEVGDGEELGAVEGLDKLPNEHVALTSSISLLPAQFMQ